MKKFLTLLFLVIFCNFIVLSLDIHRNSRHKFDFSYCSPGIYSFLFPITFLEEKGIGTKLNFNPPENSNCPQRTKFLTDPKYLGTLDFISENENENNWSRIIKFNMYPGKIIKATALITQVKDFLVKNSLNLKIIEETLSQTGVVKIATLSMTYTYKGRRELMRMKVFSGSVNCASIQYIVALKENEVENDIFEEIKHWIENPSNLKLINF